MNHLAKEPSLYLRQHANNPVNWYPWGEEAWDKARAEDKPVIVSIGYSACHWCHVMEHESFEDSYIAGLMNEHFVCIKVDREERPDVDQIYMEAVQMMHGHGGWPLNAFCLPDGRPFAGGTYFPPDDRRGTGQIPWPQLLMRVADYFKRNRADLEDNAGNILKNMRATNDPIAPQRAPALGREQLLDAAQGLLKEADMEDGGFGGAPKFPPSMSLDYLLAIRSTAAVDEQLPDLAKALDQCIQLTLDRMARGGIYDQLGGGFARYSVDKEWLIPHFEKMLYDNALLLDIFAKGFQRYRNPLYAAILEETVGWLERDMATGHGGYAAALDADSEGEEGKYYVWDQDEIAEVIGEEQAALFCAAYDIRPEGNFEHGKSNPQLLATDFEVRQQLADACSKLLAKRKERVPPGRDDKLLTTWNAMLIRGLAEAAFTLGKRDWLERACALADLIWDKLRDAETGKLSAVAYNGEAPEKTVNAYLDDYACLADALVNLAGKVDWLGSATRQSATYIERAEAIIAHIQENFGDDSGQPGYFFTSKDHEQLVARKKEWLDNAMPAGNSVLVHVLAGLYALTGKAEYSETLEQLRAAYPGYAERVPQAAGYALAGFVQHGIGIAVIKAKGIEDLEPLREAIAAKPWRKIAIIKTEDPQQPQGYQLCIGTQCLEPTDDAEGLAKRL